MFQRTHLAALLICLGGLAAWAQKPDPVLPAPPLTPAQQHDKDVGQYDPLDKSNPAAPQDPDSPQAPAAPATRRDQPTPLPGSVASSNDIVPANPHSGPRVVSGDTDSPAQEYTGPAVLSRSYTISRPMVSRQVKWSPSVGVSEIYDTGMTGGKVNPDGSLANVASTGTSYRWSFSGRHFWKHDQLGIDYSGNYNRYSSGGTYNGTNQSVNADFSHQLSRRLSFNVVASGSISSQGNSLVNSESVAGISLANVDLAASPSTQILDQGFRQIMTTTDLTYRKSARLSFNLSGGFFAVQRTGVGTFGNIGYQAKADVNYRFSRRTTIGLYYSYSNYIFAQHVQTSETNTIGGIYSYAFGRSTQFRSRLGIARSESLGLATVPIDPGIAALIGRGSAIVDQYRLALSTDASAELVKDFGRTRTGNISYARGISPGNGILMTSIQESESAGFTMILLHRYSTNAALGHIKLSSASQTISQYGTNYVTFTVSRSYGHGISGNFQVDYRRFTLSNEPVLHSQFRVTSGISWGPGTNKLW